MHFHIWYVWDVGREKHIRSSGCWCEHAQKSFSTLAYRRCISFHLLINFIRKKKILNRSLLWQRKRSLEVYMCGGESTMPQKIKLDCTRNVQYKINGTHASASLTKKKLAIYVPQFKFVRECNSEQQQHQDLCCTNCFLHCF